MMRGLDAVRRSLSRAGLTSVQADIFRASVRLSGTVGSYEEKLEAGYCAAGKGFAAVVNDVSVPGFSDAVTVPKQLSRELEGRSFDVAVIGGGVIGCSIARELSRFALTVALFEKEPDLAMHASGRNDGMIHDGFAAPPGSKKAIYNVRGNFLYTDLTRDLEVPFRRPGSLFLFRNPLMKLVIPFFFLRAKRNGVMSCRYLSRREVRSMEPNLIRRQFGAFFIPTAGMLSPHELTLALAENAAANGVSFFRGTEVTGFSQNEAGISGVETTRGRVGAAIVVNAAGCWADHVAGLADDRFFSLHFRKGVDCILDKKTGNLISHIMAMPRLMQAKEKTKGGGLVLTIEGNILVGPTADEVPFRDVYETEPSDIERLIHHFDLVPKLSLSDVISYFSGVRPCTYDEDFIVAPSDRVRNLIHVAGIQSPGLASAPAIAEDVVSLVKTVREAQGLKLEANPSFDPKRKRPVRMAELSPEEQAAAVGTNPGYGRIVCRCECVSEQEVRDALRSRVPARTLDGIKRRTRAGMGRCHGGFCTPRILEIMADELSLPVEAIEKAGPGSPVLLGRTKDEASYDEGCLRCAALRGDSHAPE